MGLREKKAARNRTRIVEEGMRLFATQGYAETTMEQIAEAVELHPSTVYRYFPSKDLIVFAEFESMLLRFSATLEATSEDIPLDDALTAAILNVLDDEATTSLTQRAIRSIIDQSPLARARLWDTLEEQRRRAATLIAARSGKSENDFDVILSARTAILIAETAADIWRDAQGDLPAGKIARELMRIFGDGRVTLPNPDA
jgi:AcrR family transcriptional regulator